MKKLSYSLLFIAFTLIVGSTAYSQTPVDSVKNQQNTKVVVTKTDGTIFIGTIISKDAREILLLTDDMGEVVIPMYVVKEIKALDASNFNANGEYIPNEVFSTRYFISTNGLPILEGENYISLNLFGPEIQFNVGENAGLGIMTSWAGSPIVFSFKKSITIDENTSIAFGSLMGIDFLDIAGNVKGILPYTALTFGNRKANFTLSAGVASFGYEKYYYEYNPTTGYSNYGTIDKKETHGLFSIGFMSKVGRNISLVFDSIMMPSFDPDKIGFGLFIPGLRFQENERKAVQFGLGVIHTDGENYPLPMLQWFRKIN